MKRIISILLSVIFIVFLAGCNETPDSGCNSLTNNNSDKTVSNVPDQNITAEQSTVSEQNDILLAGCDEIPNNDNPSDKKSDSETQNNEGSSAADTDSDKIQNDVFENNISKRDNIPFKDNQMYAVAYAGYQKMDPLEKYSEYLDTLDLPCHYVSDGEYYIIIPRYDDMDLKLYRIDTDTSDKVLFYQTADCKPFIVQCNASDICNDAFIELNYKNRKTGFSPYISLEGGGLQANGEGYIIGDLK